MLGSAQDCLQAAEGEQLPFRDDNGSPRLPSGSQAIITTYQFGCCGDITAWQTYVQPGGGGHRNDRSYDIFFQVWRRPSPTVQNDGCYSLVGENRFSSIFFGDDGLVSETPEPSNIISVQPEDVVGYYTFSRRDPNNNNMEGLQLDESRLNDNVLFLPYTMGVSTICAVPVEDGGGRTLISSTNAGPILSVSISKSSLSWLSTLLILMHIRYTQVCLHALPQQAALLPQ